MSETYKIAALLKIVSCLSFVARTIKNIDFDPYAKVLYSIVTSTIVDEFKTQCDNGEDASSNITFAATLITAYVFKILFTCLCHSEKRVIEASITAITDILNARIPFAESLLKSEVLPALLQQLAITLLCPPVKIDTCFSSSTHHRQASTVSLASDNLDDAVLASTLKYSSSSGADYDAPLLEDLPLAIKTYSDSYTSEQSQKNKISQCYSVVTTTNHEYFRKALRNILSGCSSIAPLKFLVSRF